MTTTDAEREVCVQLKILVDKDISLWSNASE